jgi:hypothetical protein
MSHACHPGPKPRYPFGPEGKERGDPTLTRSLNDRHFHDPSPSARTGVATPVRAIHHDPNGRQSHKTSGFRSFWIISARAEVIGALVGLEDVDKPSDQVPEAANSALSRLPQHGLEPGEGLLDRVEVRALGRKEAQGCADRFNPLLHCGPFVARQVVHDDHVAGTQLGHQDLRNIGFEPVTVDRAVEHHRRDHAGHAQTGDQCRGFAMPVREAHAQPLALRAAAMAAGHVGSGPRLIDENEALGIEIELTVEPALPLPQDAGAVLLDSMASLFLRVMPRRAKKR